MKCFLSHSSKEKAYIEIVAKSLGFSNCIYDDWSFEEGLKPLEEIDRTLDESSLFVLFISSSALESDWVQTELIKSLALHQSGKLKRIFPIIIDPNVYHDDERIPEWMRESYNLKYVSQPTIAARRIKQRMRELAWQCHPRLYEREKIFVGRNSLVAAFEERIDSVDNPAPVCVIASGLKRIGRKSLLHHSMVKANVYKESYRPAKIVLERDESIEDFILKINDLSLTAPIPLNDLLAKTVNEKVKIACEIISGLQERREIIMIDDNACLITREQILAPWFQTILDNIQKSERIVLSIASRVRIKRSTIRNYYPIFYLEVPELDSVERRGLFKRYSEFEKIELNSEDFKFFLGILYGFPEQVLYSVDLIRDEGLDYVKNNSYLIADYNSERVVHLLLTVSKKPKAQALLSLLARFDFISTEFLEELIQNDDEYISILHHFQAEAICESMGVNGEYIRLNEAVRDYVLRGRLDLPNELQKRLEEHLKTFLETYKSEQKDLSDLIYSLKEAIVEGKDIDEKYLAPSHFLKTMRELYDRHRRYRDVVLLAERVLLNKRFIDKGIELEIRYYMCLSLARLRDNKFLDEVQHIKGIEHNFLMGFYYRMIGKYADALERLDAALKERTVFTRARREKVQVLIAIEQYDSALTLAKQNYDDDRTNPYHIQAYFNCVLRSNPDYRNITLLRDLLKNLERLPTERSQQMAMGCRALLWAYIDNDRINAFSIAQDYCERFGDTIYPHMILFDVSLHFRDIDKMRDALSNLNNEVNRDSYFMHSLILRKAILKAVEGDKKNALHIIETELKNFPLPAIEKWRNRLNQLAEEH